MCDFFVWTQNSKICDRQNPTKQLGFEHGAGSEVFVVASSDCLVSTQLGAS